MRSCCSRSPTCCPRRSCSRSARPCRPPSRCASSQGDPRATGACFRAPRGFCPPPGACGAGPPPQAEGFVCQVACMLTGAACVPGPGKCCGTSSQLGVSFPTYLPARSKRACLPRAVQIRLTQSPCKMHSRGSQPDVACGMASSGTQRRGCHTRTSRRSGSCARGRPRGARWRQSAPSAGAAARVHALSQPSTLLQEQSSETWL